MANDKKKMVEAITAQEVDFAQWYTDICTKAELVEYSSVKGFIILRPYGQAIWENIQRLMDDRFKATGHENVAMPLMFRGVPKEVRELEAKKMLCRVGLANRMDHYPGQMYGGQQQRAGIARAFITRPDIVFADEPTGNLDSKTTKEVMEMIHRFARTFHQTIVLVSHDPEMTEYADRIVTLVDGEIVSDKKTEGRA